MGALTRRLLDVTDAVAPALARALATPAVRGVTADRVADAAVWRSSTDPRALIVYLTRSPELSRWVAGSLAVRLDAIVLAVAPSTGVVDAIAIARHDDRWRLPVDAPLVIVGEADAASAAVELSATTAAARLALLYPAGIADTAQVSASRVPTVLVQAASAGADRAAVVALDSAWRRSGVAVRETEYSGVEDGWARYPRAAKGARRALDDLVSFLDRGIGQASTFDVIPGWDLH